LDILGSSSPLKSNPSTPTREGSSGSFYGSGKSLPGIIFSSFDLLLLFSSFVYYILKLTLRVSEVYAQMEIAEVKSSPERCQRNLSE
jgi:hypothetical protein